MRPTKATWKAPPAPEVQGADTGFIKSCSNCAHRGRDLGDIFTECLILLPDWLQVKGIRAVHLNSKCDLHKR